MKTIYKHLYFIAMDQVDIIRILQNREMTRDQIADEIIGEYSTEDKSREGYLKIGAQILVENKLEFLLNEMVEDRILGMRRINSGLLEHIYYYIL